MQGLNKCETDATASSSDKVRDHDSSEQEKTLRQQVVSTPPSEGFHKPWKFYTSSVPALRNPLVHRVDME